MGSIVCRSPPHRDSSFRHGFHGRGSRRRGPSQQGKRAANSRKYLDHVDRSGRNSLGQALVQYSKGSLCLFGRGSLRVLGDHQCDAERIRLAVSDICLAGLDRLRRLPGLVVFHVLSQHRDGDDGNHADTDGDPSRADSVSLLARGVSPGHRVVVVHGVFQGGPREFLSQFS